jgi:hypothetical protein
MLRWVVGALAVAKVLELWYELLVARVPDTLTATVAIGALLAAALPSALAFMLGWHARVAGGTYFAATMVLLTAHFTPFPTGGFESYNNHSYLLTIVVFLLTLSRSDAAFAVRPSQRDGLVPGWPRSPWPFSSSPTEATGWPCPPRMLARVTVSTLSTGSRHWTSPRSATWER